MRFLILAAAVAAAGAPARGADDASLEGTVQQEQQWKERLGLSEDQLRKLQAALAAKRDAVRPHEERLRGALQQLRVMLEAHAKDSDLQPALDQVADARKAIREEEDKFSQALASFLTPSQRARLLVGSGGERKPTEEVHGRRPVPPGFLSGLKARR
jgi:Spy/CpxP family protein refolding chaperone